MKTIEIDEIHTNRPTSIEIDEVDCTRKSNQCKPKEIDEIRGNQSNFRISIEFIAQGFKSMKINRNRRDA